MTFDFELIKSEILKSPVNSSIYIGADSKVYSSKGEQMVAYVTVIILHYGTSKGAKIFKSYRTDRYYGEMRPRLLAEVGDAIAAGLEILDTIGTRSFEIHLDINRGAMHKSSVLVKEATGYVMGTLGIEPKLKPDSFAASSVADRFCVKDAKKNSDRPSAKRKYLKQMRGN
jgi:predicted RNase H-related nuclease YkuK (DUF458 family)